MKILFINKFLYPNGGSETYCFNLAQFLKYKGHKVQFFGMDHSKNIVHNDLNLGVANTEFKKISFSKIVYPFKIIYSAEARRKIKELINYFKPDIVHLNNYNFQITPSILYEIKKYNIPIVMTLHDYQLVCPNHMLYLDHKRQICEACKGRNYISCIKNKCLHNSRIKSILAAFEGWIYFKLRTYEKYIDAYISPTIFLKNKLIEFGESGERISVLPNFIGKPKGLDEGLKDNYVLYFGRLSPQKGIKTLLNAAEMLPEIKFKIAGAGELQDEIKGGNIEFLGFQSGDLLKSLISNALFTIYPSEWYENCPMSVLESQMYGTPVIGARIGGIPELIDDGVDGVLFEPGDINGLIEKIRMLYYNRSLLLDFSKKCANKAEKYLVNGYYDQLIKIYKQAINKNLNCEVQ